MSSLVQTHVDANVLTLSLNRPDRKNALTRDMYTALTAALADAASAPEVRAVVVRGEGSAFCGGNDLGDFLQHPPTGDDSPVMQFLFAIATFPKPLIAAVHGPAVGIGTTLLLHCDHAIAATNALFKMPFVQLGIVPEAASSLLVPQLVGHRRAMEVLALGEAFDASTALQLGFVNAICAPEALDAEVGAVAARYAALPPAAVRLTKQLLKAPQAEAVAAVMRTEGATFMERLSSPEAVEAMTAFLQKRAPDFSRFS
ncbi:MAG: enoyl-CoA hydratase [Alphaproteobacteria bacterium]|nr:enoyl-CoA hydratase [Alphaproteobacteria bacterium]